MVPQTEEILARLVAFDTTSHKSNLALLDYVCDLFEGTGAQPFRHFSSAGDKANLVLRLGPSPEASGERGLVLCGHSDVVPALEPDWTSDPFELVEREDSLYGRGSADMKGFIAVAIRQMLGRPTSALNAPLVLVLTFDEEVGTLGAKHLVDHWSQIPPLPKSVIIGEPTELEVIRLHKGHLKLRIVQRGVSAHSAYPHLGRNAIEPLTDLLAALRELRIAFEAIRVETSEHFPEVPFPTLNIAQIEGGTAINIVPDRAHVDVGIRLLPGMDSELCLEKIRHLAASILEPDQWSLEVLSDSPPVETASEGTLQRRLQAILGQRESRSVSFATDAGWLNRAGLECSIFGPGSIRVAHKPNEFITRSQLRMAETHLDTLIQDFCQ